MELDQHYKEEVNKIITTHELDNNLFLWGTRTAKSKWPLIELLLSKKYSCLTYKPFGYYFVFGDNNTSNGYINDYYPSWSRGKKMTEENSNVWENNVACLNHWLDSIQRTLERSKIVNFPVVDGKKIRDSFRVSTKLLSEIKISQPTK